MADFQTGQVTNRLVEIAETPDMEFENAESQFISQALYR